MCPSNLTCILQKTFTCLTRQPVPISNTLWDPCDQNYYRWQISLTAASHTCYLAQLMRNLVNTARLKTFIDYKLKQFAYFSEWHSVDLLTSLYYGCYIFILAFTEDPENSVLVFFRIFTCMQYLHEQGNLTPSPNHSDCP